MRNTVPGSVHISATSLSGTSITQLVTDFANSENGKLKAAAGHNPARNTDAEVAVVAYSMVLLYRLPSNAGIIRPTATIYRC